MNMDFKYFDDLWNQGNADLDKQKKHWDKRAEEFNQYRSHTAEQRIEKLKDYFNEKGLSYENGDVLDIGCGTGQLSLEFAKKAKSVTGLDISTEMIQFANNHASTEGITNVQFYEQPWEEIDLAALGWTKKYDLVAAIMSPAIGSRASLEKMMEASKGSCFMSGHVEKYEKVKAEIIDKVLHRKSDNYDHGRNIYCSFNILWLYGIHPELTYHTIERENDRTLEEAFIYYCAQLEMKNTLTSTEKQAIQQHLEKIARNGRVKDTFRSKSAWLYWKVVS